MPWYLIWDFVWMIAALVVLFLLFFVMCALFLIGLLYLLDWTEEQKIYNGLERAVLKRPFPKLSDEERMLV